MTTSLAIRLFVNTPLDEGTQPLLTDAQAHYLLHVMRLGAGARIRVFNGLDGEFEAEITPEGRKQIRLTIHQRTRLQTPQPTLMLAFAPIKKARVDYIASKATELGVGIIQPVLTAYTQATRIKTERLTANAIEAAEQTGRLTIPEVRPPLSLAGFLAGIDRGYHLIFCDESLAGVGGRAMLTAVSSCNGRSCTGESCNGRSCTGESCRGPGAVLIGPEGGFSPAERAEIMAHEKAIAVSLGGHVLRTETAMLAALTLWQAGAGDWKDDHG